MKINILITGGLYDSQSGYSAYQFCKTAIAAGQSIKQIFFYQAGVTQTTQLAEPLADEFNAPDEWINIATEHNIELVVCISAAERRGILSHEQSLELAKPSSNLHPIYKVAGLGALHEASLSADRTVAFK